MIKMKWLAIVSICMMLQGCVVGAAVDLAATTVLTAGKLVVKGTGAVIDAAIPDGDDDEDDKKSKKKRKNKKEQDEESDD